MIARILPNERLCSLSSDANAPGTRGHDLSGSPAFNPEDPKKNKGIKQKEKALRICGIQLQHAEIRA